MTLIVQIPEALQLDEGIWKARLSPSEARFLDAKSLTAGPLSVLLVSEAPRFDPKTGSLSFDLAAAKLLNAGTSDTAILIAATSNEPKQNERLDSVKRSIGSGDAKFLQALPANLKNLGTQLLAEVRAHIAGDLIFYQSSGKYVQAPDNFWTIRPQPRDESFRMTVRGKPESFDVLESLELRPDMTGYSSFKVSHAAQIPDMLRVLKQVRRK
jgi:hypothetical protein